MSSNIVDTISVERECSSYSESHNEGDTPEKQLLVTRTVKRDNILRFCVTAEMVSRNMMTVSALGDITLGGCHTMKGTKYVTQNRVKKADNVADQNLDDTSIKFPETS